MKPKELIIRAMIYGFETIGMIFLLILAYGVVVG